MTYFLVDCEAPWGCTSPIIAPMTECGIVLFDKPPFPVAFHWPKDGDIFDMHTWIKENTKERACFISDNPAFDWQWVAAEFAKEKLANPFGFSARRIGDFAAGIALNWHDHNDWKKLRKTKHDHTPVNDARGNAEALWSLLEIARKQAYHGDKDSTY